MAFLFKGGEQLFNEAIDLIGRKEYSSAKKKLEDAESKGYTADGLGKVYVSIIDIISDKKNRNTYSKLLDVLKDLKCSTFKFGLTEIDVADLITETDLSLKEIDAVCIGDDNFEMKGQTYISVAGEYMARIGEKNLKLDEISKGNTISTGNREGLILQAQAYYILGKGTVHKNPKLAAEYMQMAYTFRKQLGDSGEEELRLSQEYSRSCTCWICGRPANAEGIHFRSMNSVIEPVFQEMTDKDVVKPISEGARSIYVCMPCYTAISNRSDEISRIYFERAMNELRAAEARLHAEISSLRFSVAYHR